MNFLRLLYRELGMQVRKSPDARDHCQLLGSHQGFRSGLPIRASDQGFQDLCLYRIFLARDLASMLCHIANADEHATNWNDRHPNV
jgi:hypothetical protein